MKLEEKDKEIRHERREGLKGRVAVDGMLRCLSENREDVQQDSEPKDQSATTEV